MEVFKSNRIAVVSHDAGGAWYLAKLLSQHELHAKITLFLEGPAEKIFHQEFGSLDTSNLENWIIETRDRPSFDFVITGSGWSTNFELVALEHFKNQGSVCVTLLDHWVNFRRRMTRGEKLYLPNVFWVVDEYSRALALNDFESEAVEIQLIEDPLAKDIRLRRLHKSQSCNSILYVTEPISSQGLMQKSISETIINEEELFFMFAKILKLNNVKLKVKVRVHPSESKQKYEELIALCDIDAEISREPDYLEDIMRSRLVVGLESQMLVWAVAANIRACTLLPVNGRVSQLPHKEIESFEEAAKSL